MCLRLGYLAWSPDAFGYYLTTVGSQEAERLFALPSVLFRHFEGVTDPKPIVIFNRFWSCVSVGKSPLQRDRENFVFEKKFRQEHRDRLV